MVVPEPPIITCPEWGARPPRRRHTLVGPPERVITHHTAGHGPTTGEGRTRAINYARAIQRYHMDGNGWNDSGHNFLVMRSGLLLAGRWYSFAAARVGLSILSAHCPGQNDQYGIELEHIRDELPTREQLDAYVALVAWLDSRAGMRPTANEPHRRYYATTCPSQVFVDLLPRLRSRVAERINRYGRDPATRAERARFRARYYAHLL